MRHFKVKPLVPLPVVIVKPVERVRFSPYEMRLIYRVIYLQSVVEGLQARADNYLAQRDDLLSEISLMRPGYLRDKARNLNSHMNRLVNESQQITGIYK